MRAEHGSEIDQARRLAAEGQTESAIERLDALSRSLPEDVSVLYALGAIARSAGLLDEAERAFRAVLDRQPNEVEAAIAVANVLVAKGNPGAATRILTRIHNLSPQLLPASLALGAALLADDNPTDALALFDHIIGQHPDLPQAHANRAEVLARLGRYRASLAAAEHAHQLAPADARIGLNKAFALFTERRIDEGLAAYEARLAPDLPTAAIREGLGLPRWDSGPLPAGRLLIAAEQGLGDEIRFAAAVWALAQNGVPIVLESEPRLVPLLQRSLPTATVVQYDRRRSGVRPIFRYRWLDGLDEPPAAWIEAGSLPLRLGLIRETSIAPAGYIKPDEERAAGFRRWVRSIGDAKPTIGIVWGSGDQSAARHRFYPPLEAWGPVLSVPGIRFVDLQYMDSSADRAALNDMFGVEIVPVEVLDKRNDLDGTAALDAALDAVVGVSSSVAALAGAVGTSTVEVLGERNWIPKMSGRDGWLGPIQQIEPEIPGDWADVITRAAAALKELIGGG
ncbi:TPR domain protein, interruption-C [alpha proteobacterium BAL199]|jgi:tetratricopeptide (TPR) repeat protein|nr:TPR domain protein, interruption-C [alpha proteobacterium BAL199]